MNRWKLIILLLVALSLLLVYGFWPGARPVSVEEAMRGSLQVTVDEEGWTRVVDRYVISSPVPGYALRTEIDVGDSVTKGETLIKIEPLHPHVPDIRSRAEATARVAAAESRLKAAAEEMEAAAAASDHASSQLSRIEHLFGAGLVSEVDRDRAVTGNRQAAAALRSATFSVEVARYEKEAALTALLYTAPEPAGSAAGTVVITSPVSGRILKINRRDEGVVREGDPLVEIGDPRGLEIAADVLSADAVRIAEGASVTFTRWGGDTPLQGVVRVVEPAGFTKVSALGVEEQRVLVISDIISPPDLWSRLGDGYRVEASFLIWKADDVLHIPENALFRFGDGWAAFVLEGGRAHRRQVAVGQRNGLRAEIMEGLSQGESVITHPDSSLDDGSRVRVRK